VQRVKRQIAAVLIAIGLAGAVSVAHAAVMGDVIDWCQADWVKDSAFWRWYFNCP
jgi:hypothetical protein